MLEGEYLKRTLTDGPAPDAPPERRDHVGVHRQRDGRYYIGVAPTVGRVDGATLGAVADLAEAASSDQVRLTAQQKLLVLDVPEDKVAALQAGLAGRWSGRRAQRVSPWRDGLHRHRVLQARDR